MAARRRVQLGLLLSGPLGWLAVAYLGSLVVLFISAFWQLDEFSGEIVKEPTFDNFKLLWENDVYRTIAFRIVDRLRRRAANAEPVETFEDLYTQVLMAAAVVLCIGALVIRKRTELAWQAAGAVAVVLLLASVM